MVRAEGTFSPLGLLHLTSKNSRPWPSGATPDRQRSDRSRRSLQPFPSPSRRPLSSSIRTLIQALLTVGPVLGLPGWVPAPAAGIQSERVEIAGQVLDAETGVPIPVVRVELSDGRGRTLGAASTDGEGRFRFPDIGPGPVTLFAERIGYAALLVEERVVAGEALIVTLRLSPEVLTLAPFEVEAGDRPRRAELEGFTDRARRGVSGVHLTRSEIESRNAGRLTDLLSGVPGLRIVESPSVGGAQRLVSLAWNLPGRAGGGCPIQVFVNGRPAPDPGPLGGIGGLSRVDGVPVDHLVQPEDLEGIEVYTELSSVPPEFLTAEAGCGVIALWTRAGLRARTDPAGRDGVRFRDPIWRLASPH